MPSCCDPNGLSKRFDAETAEADARSYLRAGLDSDERRVIAFLSDRGVAGITVLEIGGGLGAILDQRGVVWQFLAMERS